MILVDANPLVALCDPTDGLHQRATADLERLRKAPLVLCEPALTEACFFLPTKALRQRLEQFVIELAIRPPEIDDTVGLRLEVFRWLVRYAEHDPDWADGNLAVLSQRNPKARVWTYDSEFRTIWRRPDGSRIPMATR